MKKNAAKLTKMLARGKEIGEIFKHFTLNEWVFSTANLESIGKSLSKEERETFYLDVTQIDWEKFLVHFAWGLQKFVLKEQIDSPSTVKRMDLLSSQNDNDGYFIDVNWAMTHGKNFQPSQNKVMMRRVLGSEKVKRVVEKNPKANLQRAEEICRIMFAEYNMKIMRVFAWGLHKTFKLIYEKVYFSKF